MDGFWVCGIDVAWILDGEEGDGWDEVDGSELRFGDIA